MGGSKNGQAVGLNTEQALSLPAQGNDRRGHRSGPNLGDKLSGKMPQKNARERKGVIEMVYEYWGDRMQRQLDAEKAQNAAADTAGDNPRARQLAATWEALKASGKVSETSEPVAKSEPGPLLREATQVAEAIRKIANGELVEARDGYLGRVVLPGGA